MFCDRISSRWARVIVERSFENDVFPYVIHETCLDPVRELANLAQGRGTFLCFLWVHRPVHLDPVIFCVEISRLDVAEKKNRASYAKWTKHAKVSDGITKLGRVFSWVSAGNGHRPEDSCFSSTICCCISQVTRRFNHWQINFFVR